MGKSAISTGMVFTLGFVISAILLAFVLMGEPSIVNIFGENTTEILMISFLVGLVGSIFWKD